MISRLDERVNALFIAYEDIRKLEVAGDRKLRNQRLSEGLAESCLLLRDMLGDEDLNAFGQDSNIVQTLNALEREGRLEEFLDIERNILERTDLSFFVRDELIFLLRWIARLNYSPVPEWKTKLESLTQKVCDESNRIWKRTGRKHFIKRAFVAGSGALIALANKFPPPGVPISPDMAWLSISSGTWLMSQASGNQLEKYFER